MKHELYVLTIPILWLCQTDILLVMVVVHILAAPVRAFIYWGRSMKRHPGWSKYKESWDDDEFGIGVAPRSSSDLKARSLYHLVLVPSDLWRSIEVGPIPTEISALNKGGPLWKQQP